MSEATNSPSPPASSRAPGGSWNRSTAPSRRLRGERHDGRDLTAMASSTPSPRTSRPAPRYSYFLLGRGDGSFEASMTAGSGLPHVGGGGRFDADAASDIVFIQPAPQSLGSCQLAPRRPPHRGARLAGLARSRTCRAACSGTSPTTAQVSVQSSDDGAAGPRWRSWPPTARAACASNDPACAPVTATAGAWRCARGRRWCRPEALARHPRCRHARAAGASPNPSPTISPWRSPCPRGWKRRCAVRPPPAAAWPRARSANPRPGSHACGSPAARSGPGSTSCGLATRERTLVRTAVVMR